MSSKVNDSHKLGRRVIVHTWSVVADRRHGVVGECFHDGTIL